MAENVMKNRNSAPVEEASIRFPELGRSRGSRIKNVGPRNEAKQENKMIDDVLKRQRVHGGGCSRAIIIIKHPNK